MLNNTKQNMIKKEKKKKKKKKTCKNHETIRKLEKWTKRGHTKQTKIIQDMQKKGIFPLFNHDKKTRGESKNATKENHE